MALTDKKRLEIINKFINEESVVKGGGITVSISDHNVSFTPIAEKTGMKYEDCCHLSNIIMGANHLLFYLARNGYDIIKKK